MDSPNPSFVLLFPISELYSLLAEDSPLTHRVRKWLEGSPEAENQGFSF